VLSQRNPLEVTSGNPEADLQKYITALEEGEIDVEMLKKIVLLCLENPVTDLMSPLSDIGYPASPSPFMSSNSLHSLQQDIWERNKNFDRLFKALSKRLVTLKVGQYHDMFVTSSHRNV
jgi:CLIP-associating protein 1/2